MATSITRLEYALDQRSMAKEAGEDAAAWEWEVEADVLRGMLQREADTAARNMARVTGSRSARYEITHTDGTVAVVGTWSR